MKMTSKPGDNNYFIKYYLNTVLCSNYIMDVHLMFAYTVRLRISGYKFNNILFWLGLFFLFSVSVPVPWNNKYTSFIKDSDF